MINMIKLDFVPLSCEWIYSPGDAISALAVSAQESNRIFIYDGQGTGAPLHVFERLHTKPVVAMKVRQININSVSYACYVTVLLYVFIIYSIILFMKHVFPWIKQAFWNIGQDQKSPDGKKFASLSGDRKVRVFNFRTGKLYRVFDETLQRFTELQQMTQQLPNMEFGQRYAYRKR